jgi:putative GTP pyrophosphokinase
MSEGRPGPLDGLLADYNRLYPTYEEFAQRLSALVTSWLDNEGIVHAAEARAKDPLRLLEKAHRPEKLYVNPLDEITDLAGVRVIVESTTAVERVATLLRDELEVDAQRSIDKVGQLRVDQFGYLSQHFIVRLKAPRSVSREWRHLSGYWAEVQVRSALQHAWAQVEHSLVYKPESDLPAPLRRRFHALAAVFELADRELADLIAEGRKLIDERKADITAASEDVELTTLSMVAYLEQSDTVKYWLGVVRTLQVGVGPIGLADRAAEMAKLAGVATVSELEALLRSAKGWGEEFLRLFFSYTFSDPVPSLHSMDISGIPTVFLIASFPDVFSEDLLEGPLGFGGSWRVTRAAREARQTK